MDNDFAEAGYVSPPRFKQLCEVVSNLAGEIGKIQHMIQKDFAALDKLQRQVDALTTDHAEIRFIERKGPRDEWMLTLEAQDILRRNTWSDVDTEYTAYVDWLEKQLIDARKRASEGTQRHDTP